MKWLKAAEQIKGFLSSDEIPSIVDVSDERPGNESGKQASNTPRKNWWFHSMRSDASVVGIPSFADKDISPEMMTVIAAYGGGNFGNWRKDVVTVETVTVGGQQYAVLGGKTYFVHKGMQDEGLRGIGESGFRFSQLDPRDPKSKVWSCPIAAAPACISKLRSLGVNVSGGVSAPAPTPATPAATAPAAQPAPAAAPTAPQVNSQRAQVKKGKDGADYLAVSLNGMPDFNGALSAVKSRAFRWNSGEKSYDPIPGMKVWVKPVNSLTDADKQMLGAPPFSASIPGLIEPQSQPAGMTQDRGTEPSADPGKPWTLARSVKTQAILAVKNPATEGAEPWYWEDIDANDGEFPPGPEGHAEFTIEMTNGQQTIGSSPDEILDPLRKKQEAEEKAAKGPVAPDPSQQAVLDAFNQGQQHLVINALAGTGKTWTLEQLAKIVGKAREASDHDLRCVYLVFNKRNQIEGTERFAPHGVEVHTTNSFLGKLLDGSGLEEFRDQKRWDPDAEDEPGKPLSEEDVRVKRAMKKSKSYAGLLIDRLMDGTQKYWAGRNKDYQAKKFVMALVPLAKNYMADVDQPETLVPLLKDLIQKYPDKLNTKLLTREQLEGREAISAEESQKDFTNELIEDTIEALGYCLPGQGNRLVEKMMPQRIADEKRSLTQGKWERVLARRRLEALEDFALIAKRNYRDFDDDFWFTSLSRYRDQLPWQYFDYVFSDEAQDFNLCQHNMLNQLAKQNQGSSTPRLVSVGDTHQNMYYFRGAQMDSLKKLETTLGTTSRGVQVLDLLYNHRCGKNIIDAANNSTDPMKSLPPEKRLQADEDHTNDPRKVGEVLSGVEYKDALSDVSSEWKRRGNRMRMSTAFLSRNNGVLAKAALQLLRDGVNFEIIGRDFSGSLTKYIREVLKYQNIKLDKDDPRLSDMSSMISEYHSHLVEVGQANASMAETVKESAGLSEALVGIISHLKENNNTDPRFTDRSRRPIPITDTSKFMWFLETIFKGQDLDNSKNDIMKRRKVDPRTVVSLTTAHRAKGLEWDRVFILNVEDFPSPNAKTAADRVVEGNIFYVACTRARKSLQLVNRPPKEESADAGAPPRQRYQPSYRSRRRW